MKLLDQILRTFQHVDDLKSQLFAFLSGDEQEFGLIGGRSLSRDDARELLQELIPAQIEVRAICGREIAAVAAAPHVSFDNWSEYFCNRIARRLRIGWVVAKNFRDQHPQTIPVSIGRHIHVNRPTESNGPGQSERETERARDVYRSYLASLTEAAGVRNLPLDFLIELHSQHRTPDLEIAAAGLTEDQARHIADCYVGRNAKRPRLPDIKIAPLHPLRLTADAARTSGSIRTEIARIALHVEVPREARQDEEARRTMCAALIAVGETLLLNMSAEKNT